MTLPVSGLGELAVVPSLVLGGGTHSPPRALSTSPTITPSSAPPVMSLAGLPLDKAWDRMSEVLHMSSQSLISRVTLTWATDINNTAMPVTK